MELPYKEQQTPRSHGLTNIKPSAINEYQALELLISVVLYYTKHYRLLTLLFTTLGMLQ